MKIVVDVFGGDNAPEEILNGAEAALLCKEDINLVLVGNETVIGRYISEHNIDKNRVEILHAKDVISNDDVPTEAIRKKNDSSLVKCFEYLNNNSDAEGLVSAGSTGAVLTGAVLLLKRIRGINRPALCPVLPTVNNSQVLLIDCGANVEPKALNLIQFALLGSAYAKSVFGVKQPRISLLNNGTEEHKGTSLNKEVYQMLKSNPNFIGNIEAREILSGQTDVVVCDGYSGNIALKGCEGTALSMFQIIKDNILAGGLRAKLGYLLLKPVFKKVKVKMDYNDNGGAVLLGLEKIIVKSHGSSKAKAIKNSIIQIYDMVNNNLVENIKSEIANGVN